MSAYRPLFVDAEAAIDAARCRCRVLCLCAHRWDVNEFRRRQLALVMELRGLAMGATDILD